MRKHRNKTSTKNETTKHRITLPIGPESVRVINGLAARYRKESGCDWSQAEVVAAAAGLGLRSLASQIGFEYQPSLALID